MAEAVEIRRVWELSTSLGDAFDITADADECSIEFDATSLTIDDIDALCNALQAAKKFVETQAQVIHG